MAAATATTTDATSSSSRSCWERVCSFLRYLVAPAGGTRLLELDSYRGIAASAVVLFHLAYHYGIRCGWVDSPPVGADLWAPFGEIGISLFFMISGFVILMTIRRASSLADFWFSRFTRLYPTFWICLLLSTAVEYWLRIGVPLPRWYDVVLNASIVPYYIRWPLKGDSPTNITMTYVTQLLDGSYWTLSPEMTFYFDMSLLYAVGALSHLRGVLSVWLVVNLADRIVCGYSAWWRDEVVASAVRMFLLSQWANFFGAGMLFYLILESETAHARDHPSPTEEEQDTEKEPLILNPEEGARKREPTFSSLARRHFRSLGRFVLRQWWCLLLLVICFLPPVFWPGDISVLDAAAAVAIFYLLFAFLVYSSLHPGDSLPFFLTIIRRVLISRPFVFLGSISYALYLLHQDISMSISAVIIGSDGVTSSDARLAFSGCVAHAPLMPWLPSTLLVAYEVVMMVVLATAVTYLFEKPVMDSLRGWYRRRKKKAAAAAAAAAVPSQ